MPKLLMTKVADIPEIRIARLEQSSSYIQNDVTEIKKSLIRHDERLDKIDKTLEVHTRILDEHSQRFITMQQTLDVLEDKMDRGFARVDSRFDTLEALIRQALGLTFG